MSSGVTQRARVFCLSSPFPGPPATGRLSQAGAESSHAAATGERVRLNKELVTRNGNAIKKAPRRPGRRQQPYRPSAPDNFRCGPLPRNPAAWRALHPRPVALKNVSTLLLWRSVLFADTGDNGIASRLAPVLAPRSMVLQLWFLRLYFVALVEPGARSKR